MRIPWHHPLALGIAALAGAAATAPAQQTPAEATHTITTPEEIAWRAGPPSLPPGAQMAVLYGDPGSEGPFAMRLRLPANYAIPPHTHGRPEIVTVLSGTFHLGMGEMADQERTKPLPAGGFFAFPPGMAHYAFTREETVVQLNSTGPWTLTYVHPADDPRRQAAGGGR
ncbi:cupin domain-containing protein [Crenalkalicoccus roseus]|uniref:cupin domain-containing protein n=1 Tax=Crenalkalicoccus roseus TaxID=1485588 RepID=UPI001080EE5B|nr:cupin domain-containing protein [Crenalkalicoccus roseus]